MVLVYVKAAKKLATLQKPILYANFINDGICSCFERVLHPFTLFFSNVIISKLGRPARNVNKVMA